MLYVDGRTDEIPLRCAESAVERGIGLICRLHIQAPLLLEPCRAVHSFGVPVPLDIAFYRRDAQGLVVLRTATLWPMVSLRWCLRAHGVIEAAHGHLRCLGISAGTRLRLRPTG